MGAARPQISRMALKPRNPRKFPAIRYLGSHASYSRGQDPEGLVRETTTVKVLITAPKKIIILIRSSVGASIGAKKILLKSLVALKLGWRLVNRTLHTKAQRFLFSKRRFKKFSTAVGAINRAQQSSLTSKWRLN